MTTVNFTCYGLDFEASLTWSGKGESLEYEVTEIMCDGHELQYVDLRVIEKGELKAFGDVLHDLAIETAYEENLAENHCAD